MQMALQQRALQTCYADYRVRQPLSPCLTNTDTIDIETTEQTVGSDSPVSYDNERPRHQQTVKRFSIASKPVNNAEFLAFIEDNGYQNKTLWSAAGWQWLAEYFVDKKPMAPEHWRQDESSHWYAINHNGAFELPPEGTLYGINYYEASAYASWRGARLPHEHEWEVAAATRQLKHTAEAWEWCHNRFYPYPGFKAFPYAGYSEPWFEQPHFVLKGGSLHTQKSIRRRSFRNFFGPDKRHIFAGCRLVYS